MNKQQGFSKILAIIIGLLVIGGGFYLYTNSIKNIRTVDPQNPPENLDDISNITEDEDTGKQAELVDTGVSQNQGVTYVPENDRVKVTYPSLNSKITIGEVLTIKWGNYSGNQNLNIGLQVTKTNGQIIEAKNIATNVPNTGKYDWTVSSESPNNKYKIEIHPYGDRARVGRSESFSIVGDLIIKDVSPATNSRVNASKPIEIKGLAKGVFSEGEFGIEATYVLDGETKIIDKTYATCSLNGDGCDWTSSNFLEFKSTVDLSSSPVCFVNISFIKTSQKDSENSKNFFELPLWLYNINNCQ